MVLAQVNICELINDSLVSNAAAQRIDKELEQLLYEVSSACAARANNSDHVRTVQVSIARPWCPAVNGLSGVIVFGLIHDKLEAERVRIVLGAKEFPAGEGSRDLFYIFLGVIGLAGNNIGDSHRE